MDGDSMSPTVNANEKFLVCTLCKNFKKNNIVIYDDRIPLSNDTGISGENKIGRILATPNEKITICWKEDSFTIINGEQKYEFQASWNTELYRHKILSLDESCLPDTAENYYIMPNKPTEYNYLHPGVEKKEIFGKAWFNLSKFKIIH